MMSRGSVYIMQNPAFSSDMLKIGRTEREVFQRAKELSTTGLPDDFNVCYERDVPDCFLAEKRLHQKLKRYRYRANREFFILPLDQAISTVEEVIYNEFENNSPQPPRGIHKLNKETTFRWNFYSKSILLLFRYKNWLTDKPNLENFWGCKLGDHVLLTTRPEDDPSKLIKLAKDHGIQDSSLSEIINIYPGDRFVVIGSLTASQQLSLFEPELSIISIIDCCEYAKMIGFMENIEIHREGFPIPFGDTFDDNPPPVVHEAFNRVLEMGPPDVYPTSEYIKNLHSGFIT